MKKQKHVGIYWWCIPLCFLAMDANAWGLYTHLHFAQSLLLATPLLDKRFRNAIKRYPELVLAGACLPDLAVISKAFSTTHQWQKATYLLESARNDQELAIAVGYANHLYVDVIAHNHFVPAHEALWENHTMFTHISSEWAMDAHISHTIEIGPGRLLSKHANVLSQFIAPCFEQTEALVRKKLLHLSYADRLLRLAQLPGMIRHAIRIKNRHKHKDFDYYIQTTKTALADFHMALVGHHPHWEPEVRKSASVTITTEWRTACLLHLKELRQEPITYYKPIDSA